MPVGRVKWYDKSKGYGFIECPEGDVFFHFSDILMEGFKALAEDQRVAYKLIRSPEGLKAKEVKPLDQRATVKSAARYRAMIYLQVKEGCEDAFDELVSSVPGWYDEFEQDLGLRRIGTWRSDQHAIRLVESDKPYDRAMEAARTHPKYESYLKWQDSLMQFLSAEPRIMSPVLPPETPGNC